MTDGTVALFAAALIWLTAMVLWLAFRVRGLRNRLEEMDHRDG